MAKGCRSTLALIVVIALFFSTPGTAPAAERQILGWSVMKRPIIEIRLGAPVEPFNILVIGSIHGNETAGMRVAKRLLASAPPHDVQFLVVPTINPDGVAAGTRGNAHGVDLNRNFLFRWRPLGGGEYSGTGPLSEPESRAVHRLIIREKPDVTIWFHQPFGLVDRPEGNPFAARRFSQLIGLPLVRLRGAYPGSASRWQNHRFPQSTAFVVELPRQVSGALVNRGAAAVRSLAAELASPAVTAGLPR